jgi:hypothetical protein
MIGWLKRIIGEKVLNNEEILDLSHRKLIVSSTVQGLIQSFAKPINGDT